MKLARVLWQDELRVGLMRAAPTEIALLPRGTSEILDVVDPAFEARSAWQHATVVHTDDVAFLPPITPTSIRDYFAFEDHIRAGYAWLGRELPDVWYESPAFYFTNAASVYGHGQVVRVPAHATKLDFELEVAAVIAREGADLDVDRAADHIAGFCLLNDWSARDLQAREMELGLGPGKGKDFGNSLGPFLVTPDELAERRDGKGYDIELTVRVNGRTYATGNLKDLHWSFEEMVAHASRDTRVRPGDVIGSGTCTGGCILELSRTHGEDAFPWLEDGDLVELEADGFGVLANTVARSRAAIPAGATNPPPGRHDATASTLRKPDRSPGDVAI